MSKRVGLFRLISATILVLAASSLAPASRTAAMIPPPDNEPPDVIVTGPNGGEVLEGGSQCTITWSALDDLTPIQQLKITVLFSPDAGGTFEEVVQLDDNPGIFSWQVPDLDTDRGLIRVEAADQYGAKGIDVSDAAFSINASAPAPTPPPVVQWARTFGGDWNDGGYSVQSTFDGGYVITGYTDSLVAVNFDTYLIKTDASGNIVFGNHFGGDNGDYGNSVQQTSDEGYIITGFTSSFGAGHSDVYLIKTGAAGNAIWSRTYGGAGNDEGRSVQQTQDGGYVIAGLTDSFGAGGQNMYVIKTDASGNVTWSTTVGGVGDEWGNSVVQTGDGGFVIAGQTYVPGPGFSEVFLVKLNATGNLTWTKTFGGADLEDGTSVGLASDGGYVVAGFTSSYGAGDFDVYLVKTDSVGNLEWSKTYGGASTEVAYSVEQTPDGGYVVAGWTSSFGAGDRDVYLIKTDSYGEMAWSKTLGGAGIDQGYTVLQTPDGGYAVGGLTDSFGSGLSDAWLIKLGPPGSIVSGDANGDGVVNALDITMVERIIVGLALATAGADANQDGSVNALDITQTERIIAGL